MNCKFPNWRGMNTKKPNKQGSRMTASDWQTQKLKYTDIQCTANVSPSTLKVFVLSFISEK